MEKYTLSFLRHYNRAFPFTRIPRDWQDIWVKRICTTQGNSTIIICHIWKMDFVELWEIVTNSPGMSLKKGNDASHNYSFQGPNWVGRNEHLGITSEGDKRQPVCIDHDRSLHKVHETRIDDLDDRFASHNCFKQLGNTIWVFQYVLSENRTQFISSLFELLCVLLGSKQLTTTVYHLKTSKPAEIFKKPIIAMLLYYVTEHHRDWYIYLKSLMYTNNAQVHTSSKLP